MFDHILMVCVGNICRSPMAEAMMKHALAHAGKPARVSSAGIRALVAQPADEQAITLLTERGLDIGAHRARQLTADLMRQHDLILVMEDWQVQAVEKFWPGARGRVHAIGRWQGFDVPDPYRKPRSAFEHALGLIDDGINDWITRL